MGDLIFSGQEPDKSGFCIKVQILLYDVYNGKCTKKEKKNHFTLMSEK